ncbi:DedA family protein [Bifidobacterium sp. SMB2]|uniref:DedA family protein n=1 Tax=Bifidobacterium saimiriisciurei TaxID=2661627 RepID=A0ABX0C9U7_9BIFI|nr:MULTISPECIES: DedA family protein [Bifidobacterium]NEG95593.1 DedA family protein [Bifidobacterium sp. SMB2]NEH11906.1 DedA family protein [Bifidobacterium saimiriisciurei]
MTFANTVTAAAAAPVCPSAQPGLVGAMTDWLVSLMSVLGGPGVGLAIALESVFPPIPSEIILPLAGFTASTGRLSLLEAIIWATIGSLVGAWVLYGVSRWIGLERLLAIADRVPGVSRADIEKADRWFARFGSWSVLIGRVIPVVRSLISIPAGFNAMNFARFTGWTLLGSSVWNTILIGSGYLLGENWCSMLGALGVFEDVIVAVVALAVVALLVRWVHNLIGNARKGGDR